MNLLTVIFVVGIGVLCFYCTKGQKKEKKNERKSKSSKSVSEKSASIVSKVTSTRRRIKSKESVRSPRQRSNSTRSVKTLTNEGTHALVTSTSQGACHCGNWGHFNIADNLPQPDERHPYRTANEPIMHPINYNNYVPVDCTQPPAEENAQLCMNALSNVVEPPLNILTAFNPILHAIYFSHHYAEMLSELIENYDYFG